MNVYCFTVDIIDQTGEWIGDHNVIALGETMEEAKAKVVTKFDTDVDLVHDMHLPDVLGDFYDCVATLS